MMVNTSEQCLVEKLSPLGKVERRTRLKTVYWPALGGVAIAAVGASRGAFQRCFLVYGA